MTCWPTPAPRRQDGPPGSTSVTPVPTSTVMAASGMPVIADAVAIAAIPQASTRTATSTHTPRSLGVRRADAYPGIP
jgi:hypothetical protein